MWLYSPYLIFVQIYIFLLELTWIYAYSPGDFSMFPGANRTCCNGILGFAGPDKNMPCSEMRCCNAEETVALQKVNHALGFCFRCVSQTVLDRQPNDVKKCYTNGEQVASSNSTTMEYTLKTCCRDQDLKFTVITYLNDIALTIKCVKRWGG